MERPPRSGRYLTSAERMQYVLEIEGACQRRCLNMCSEWGELASAFVTNGTEFVGELYFPKNSMYGRQQEVNQSSTSVGRGGGSGGYPPGENATHVLVPLYLMDEDSRQPE